MLNELQKKAVLAEGPVLVIAGPGTGKTKTIVEKLKYLLFEKKVPPEQILVTTFTNKATNELLTRISDACKEEGERVDLQELNLGNFHQLSHRILKEYMDYTDYLPGYRTLTPEEEFYLVYLYRRKFFEIPALKSTLRGMGVQTKLRHLIRLMTDLDDHVVDTSQTPADPQVQAIFSAHRLYKRLLKERNAITYSGLLRACYELLEGVPSVLEALQDRYHYIMVDEYQDTNFVQEEILRLLSGKHKNLFVVGDDDQGLYRFRGATIKNLLTFPRRYPGTQVIIYEENYRSKSQILRFFQDFMERTPAFGFEWGPFRYDKTLRSGLGEDGEQAVSKILAEDETAWQEEILKLLKQWKAQGLKGSQIAFLFSSIKDPRVVRLQKRLEEEGYSVYSQRTESWMDSPAVARLIALLYTVFQEEVEGWMGKRREWMKREGEKLRNPYLSDYERREQENLLSQWHQYERFLEGLPDVSTSNVWVGMEKARPDTLPDLLYYLLGDAQLQWVLKEASEENREAKNLAEFMKRALFFSYLNAYYRLTEERREEFAYAFFLEYLPQVYEQRPPVEQEEFTPEEDQLVFLTIHSSKGMEFPVVVVGSLWENPFFYKRRGIEEKLATYFEKGEESPYTGHFDFFRKYYTAFSRAKNRLVLVATEGEVSKFFRSVLEDLPEGVEPFEPEALRRQEEKEILSYTTDLSVYEHCPYLRLVQRKWRFPDVTSSQAAYGLLVHEILEEIHRSQLRGEERAEEIMDQRLLPLARMLFRNGAIELTKEKIEKARGELEHYLKVAKDQDFEILETEWSTLADFGQVFLQGKVDGVVRARDGIRLVDFKTGEVPDVSGHHPKMEVYKGQLALYAYLYWRAKGELPAGTMLYFTGAEYPLHSFSVSEDLISEEEEKIETLLRRMEEGYPRTKIRSRCRHCKMRYACDRADYSE